MNRVKVRDRFEFPLHLNMFPYTAEGLEAAVGTSGEAAGAASGAGAGASGAGAGTSGAGASDASAAGGSGAGATAGGDGASVSGAAAAAAQSREQYHYELKGIVVHAGSAFVGHYYSYIKVRHFAVFL